jgi:hypothetical protein
LVTKLTHCRCDSVWVSVGIRWFWTLGEPGLCVGNPGFDSRTNSIHRSASCGSSTPPQRYGKSRRLACLVCLHRVQRALGGSSAGGLLERMSDLPELRPHCTCGLLGCTSYSVAGPHDLDSGRACGLLAAYSSAGRPYDLCSGLACGLRGGPPAMVVPLVLLVRPPTRPRLRPARYIHVVSWGPRPPTFRRAFPGSRGRPDFKNASKKHPARLPSGTQPPVHPGWPADWAGEVSQVSRGDSLCYAIVLPGRKSALRAGFWPDCYRGLVSCSGAWCRVHVVCHCARKQSGQFWVAPPFGGPSRTPGVGQTSKMHPQKSVGPGGLPFPRPHFAREGWGGLWGPGSWARTVCSRISGPECFRFLVTLGCAATAAAMSVAQGPEVCLSLFLLSVYRVLCGSFGRKRVQNRPKLKSRLQFPNIGPSQSPSHSNIFVISMFWWPYQKMVAKWI